MNKRINFVIVLVLVGLIGGAKFFWRPRHQEINLKQARAKGNPQARVKIVEFIDFQCPACA